MVMGKKWIIHKWIIFQCFGVHFQKFCFLSQMYYVKKLCIHSQNFSCSLKKVSCSSGKLCICSQCFSSALAKVLRSPRNLAFASKTFCVSSQNYYVSQRNFAIARKSIEIQFFLSLYITVFHHKSFASKRKPSPGNAEVL